jgi:hypothetical protein
MKIILLRDMDKRIIEPSDSSQVIQAKCFQLGFSGQVFHEFVNILNNSQIIHGLFLGYS